MQTKGNKKFLYILLPIVAVVISIVSILGIVWSANRPDEFSSIIGAEELGAITSTENVEEETQEEKKLYIKGCTFEGTNTHLNVLSGTSYIVEDCEFSGSSVNTIIVKSGATLVLDNTKIINCTATAIKNNGTLTIQNGSEISGINAAESNGGAIYNAGNLTISDSKFDNNNSKLGGVIYSTGNVTINGGSFTSNTAKNGGVIYTNGETIITGGEFLTNVAEQWGGVIYSSDNITLSSCILDGGNTAETNVTNALNGGAIYLSAQSLTIKDGTIIKNCSASSSGGAIACSANTMVLMEGGEISGCKTNENGGAIVGAALNMTGGTISGCSASSNGGIIYTNSSVTLSNCILDGGNSADNSITNANCGGAIYLGSDASVITINEGTLIKNFNVSTSGGVIFSGSKINMLGGKVSNCTATQNGGVFYSNKMVTLSNCELDGGNTETTNLQNATNGGCIYLYFSDETVNINDGTLIKNFKVSNEGGAIFSNGAINVTGGEFLSNVSLDSGGTLCSLGNISLSNCTLDGGNTKDTSITNAQYGGAIYIGANTRNATITINEGTTIKNFKVSYSGGAVYSTRNVILTDCILDGGNTSDTSITNAQNGGAIIMDNLYRATLTINEGTIIKNFNASAEGGAIRSSTIMDVTGGEFIANTAKNGGTITAYNNVTLSNCILDGGNTESVSIVNAERGGAIYYDGSSLTINSGTIIKNFRASVDGGAILSGGTVNILGGTISSCAATNLGGVIYSNNIVNLTDCTLDGGNTNGIDLNNSVSGGALYIDSSGSVNVNSNVIIKNFKSSEEGGAICSIGALNVTGGEFISNSSQLGGAIIAYATTSISSAEFVSNSATNGGALYFGTSSTASDNTINATFRANIASENGGSIALYDGSSATINSDFTNYDVEGNLLNSSNNAVFGGAIYLSTGDGNVVINGGSYTGLKSSTAGGAITNLATININNVTFTSCSSRMGGAIANSVYSTGNSIFNITLVPANLYMGDVTFSGCTATDKESNAVVNIANLYLTGPVMQTTSDQDICIARITVLAVKSAQGAIYNNTSNQYELSISYGDASLESSTDFSTIVLNASGTKSEKNASIPSTITVNKYSAS